MPALKGRLCDFCTWRRYLLPLESAVGGFQAIRLQGACQDQEHHYRRWPEHFGFRVAVNTQNLIVLLLGVESDDC
jgi:hypothetical protein